MKTIPEALERLVALAEETAPLGKTDKRAIAIVTNWLALGCPPHALKLINDDEVKPPRGMGLHTNADMFRGL